MRIQQVTGRELENTAIVGDDGKEKHVADADSEGQANIQGRDAFTWSNGSGAASDSGWWDIEPNVGRVAHGIPKRVDRLRGLGNAVVPQIVEWIGRRIIAVTQEVPCP
jgi:DNA (cytosine-5)-methyltransferase 1